MRSTDRIELVETHALSLSLSRLAAGEKNGYDDMRWRRALYHALAMSRIPSNSMLTQIRVALDLP